MKSIISKSGLINSILVAMFTIMLGMMLNLNLSVRDIKKAQSEMLSKQDFVDYFTLRELEKAQKAAGDLDGLKETQERIKNFWNELENRSPLSKKIRDAVGFMHPEIYFNKNMINELPRFTERINLNLY